MEIYTIGFTKKTAEEFFEILRNAGIKLVVDVRLNNTSQMAAFTKRDDLRYFLKEICGADYIHNTDLAPTQELMDGYRGKEFDWDEYVKKFSKILKDRKIEKKLDRKLFSKPTALLCSEASADNCHRRLVAEFLRDKWGEIDIIHL